MEKKLSVIIPVFNTEKFIERCINSVISCESEEIEIIIVNDGSTDSSREIVTKNFNDERISIIDKSNGGLASARNKGVKEANGEYVLHLDSDDYLDNGVIEEILNGIESGSEVIIFDIKVVSDNGDLIRLWKDTTLEYDTQLDNKSYLKEFFLRRGSASVANKAFKRTLYLDFGIWHPENISYGEDGSTMPRLVSNANCVYKIKGKYYNYVQHSVSMMGSSTNDVKKIRDYHITLNIIEDYFKNKDWFHDYSFSVKYLYLYSKLNKWHMSSGAVQRNPEIKKAYDLFLSDVRLWKNKLNFKDYSLSYIYYLFIFYKINWRLGEFLKRMRLNLLRLYRGGKH
ncbi:glycosyltransferase family 2 protein [Vibrio sp. 10N.247.311.59]|uniref:glycosyltransferase family 2 protein n=1 Tax=Vibrio sp. 10N.247.311.59 TaxID=3229989 RepID=UPI00354D817F